MSQKPARDVFYKDKVELKMSNCELQAVRLKYKNQIKEKLNWLKQTAKWRQFLIETELENYDFIIPDSSYSNDLLNLMINSYQETNSLAQIFNIDKKTAIIHLKKKLKFVLKYGKGLMAINTKTNEIDAFTTFLDKCDVDDIEKPQEFYENFVETGNLKYVGELIE